MTDWKTEAGDPCAWRVWLAGVVMASLAILTVQPLHAQPAPPPVPPGSLNPADGPFNPLVPFFPGLPDWRLQGSEWTGGDNAPWFSPGSWGAWDPAGMFMFPPGPPPEDHAADPFPIGGRAIFGDRGSPASRVDAASPGQGHWALYGLWFVPAYTEETIEIPDPDDPPDGVLEVDIPVPDGSGESYDLRGNALFIGVEGIQNVGGAEQTIRNDIWLHDDIVINGGGGLMFPTMGGRIDTSFEDTKDLWLAGWVHLVGHQIVGDGDVIIGMGDPIFGNAYFHNEQLHTGQTVLFNGRAALGHERSLGQHDTVWVAGGEAVINRIFGIYGEELVLDYNWDLEAHLHIGTGFRPEDFSLDLLSPAVLAEITPEIPEAALGGHIVLNGDIDVLDDNWGIVTEAGATAEIAGRVDADVHAFLLRSMPGSALTVTGTIEGTGGTVEAVDGGMPDWTGVSVVADGGGRTILDSANIFFGDFLLRDGVLDLEHAQAFGNAERVIFEDEAMIRAGMPFEIDQEVDFAGTLIVGNRHPLTFTGPITVHIPSELRVHSNAPTVIAAGADVTLDDDLTVRGTTDVRIRSDISGTGGLIKRDPNTLWLYGTNTHTGLTEVLDGRLALDGDSGASLAGDLRVRGAWVQFPAGAMIGGEVTLEREGRLIGAGTVDSLVVQDRGEVRPGTLSRDDEFVSLMVDNDADFEWNSRTFLRVAGSTDSDQIVVGGTATLDEGAQFRLVPVGTSFIPDGAEYTLLSAGTLVDGGGFDPDDVGLATGRLLLRFEGAFEADEYIVRATRRPFASSGRVQRGTDLDFARALDRLVETGNVGPLVAAIDAAATDIPSYNRALRRENPVVYTGAVDSTLQMTRGFHSEMHTQAHTGRLGRQFANHDQFGPVVGNDNTPLYARSSSSMPQFAQGDGWGNDWGGRTSRYEYGDYGADYAGTRDFNEIDNPFNVWVAGFGQMDRVDSTSDRIGTDADTAGFMVGMDYSLSPQVFIGVTAGYSTTSVDFNEGRGDGDVDTFRVGPYIGLAHGNFFLDASATWGRHENDYTLIGISGLESTADFTADDVTAHVSGGYRHRMDNGQTMLIPTAAVTYTHYMRDGFEEDGGLAAKRFDEQDVDSLETTLGLRIEHHVITDGPRFVPNAFLGWSHEFMADDNDVTFQFVGTPDSFTIAGPSPNRNAIRAGGGLNVVISDTMTGFIQYDGRFSSDETTHALTGGFGLQF
ncbi:MAG: autotransporter domain-containing protein [Phycisphaeraceae bacterium]